MPLAQVVINGYGVPRVQQLLRADRSDITGTTGHEYFHWARTIPIPPRFDNPPYPSRPPHNRSNSASSIIFTPSFCAFSSFDPASSPATTKSVFLLTLPLTLPPAASIRAVASSRFNWGSVPVSTNVLPANAPALARGRCNSDLKFTSALRRRSIKFALRGSPRQRTTLSAITSPTSSQSFNWSTLAANTSSRVAKPRPRALATPAPTCRIPRPYSTRHMSRLRLAATPSTSSR